MNIAALDFNQYRIAAVIPAYRVEHHIEAVLRGLPPYVSHIIVVDDCSPDHTFDLATSYAQNDRRILLLRHERNLGIGSAMATGFQKALELGAQLVVKIDGDGQMDPALIPNLLAPLIRGEADYTKGNRFRDFEALRHMPLVRRVGNLGLSFLAKAATGYWNCFDPTNGFIAIRSEVLAQLPLEKIDHSYFFETSMLAQLYLLDAYVQDIPMPARYGLEVSSLSIRRVLFEFPPRLLVTFLRRIILKNFLYDFSILSIYMLIGVPLLLFGLIFGTSKWIEYAEREIPAPTGTVILPTLSVILAIQILLSAIEIDLKSVPQTPLSKPLPG